MISARINHSFLLSGLADGVRLDGRSFGERRRLSLQFSRYTYGQVEVSLGETKSLCIIDSEIVEPYVDSPNEGLINFSVDLSSLPNFEYSSVAGEAVEISRLIERLLKGSRALDLESLCLVGAKKVWSIRVEVHGINDAGNLRDACALAAIAGIMHFKRKEVLIDGDSVTPIPYEEREPLPLCIHHVPILVTLAQVEGFSEVLVDAELMEESVISGQISMAFNQHGELCGIYKPGGLLLTFDDIHNCSEIAKRVSMSYFEALQEALKHDNEARMLARKNLHQKYNLPSIPVEWDSSSSYENSHFHFPLNPMLEEEEVSSENPTIFKDEKAEKSSKLPQAEAFQTQGFEAAGIITESIKPLFSDENFFSNAAASLRDGLALPDLTPIPDISAYIASSAGVRTVDSSSAASFLQPKIFSENMRSTNQRAVKIFGSSKESDEILEKSVCVVSGDGRVEGERIEAKKDETGGLELPSSGKKESSFLAGNPPGYTPKKAEESANRRVFSSEKPSGERDLEGGKHAGRLGLCVWGSSSVAESRSCEAAEGVNSGRYDDIGVSKTEEMRVSSAKMTEKWGKYDVFGDFPEDEEFREESSSEKKREAPIEIEDDDSMRVCEVRVSSGSLLGKKATRNVLGAGVGGSSALEGKDLLNVHEAADSASSCNDSFMQNIQSLRDSLGINLGEVSVEQDEEEALEFAKAIKVKPRKR